MNASCCDCCFFVANYVCLWCNEKYLQIGMLCELVTIQILTALWLCETVHVTYWEL